MALIELTGAFVSLDNHAVLQDISWQLQPGEHWAVLGGNGAGKSTFLRLLAGLIWPRPHDSRRYAFDGTVSWSPLRAREHTALLSPETQERYWRQLQDGTDHEKGWNLAAWEAIAAGIFGSELLHQNPTTADLQRTAEVIHQLHLEDLAERPLQTLSQGQLRRVLLARAVVARPRVLFLDEACSGLDAASRHEMLDLIQSLAEGGQQIVTTTHREAEIVPAINRVLRLEHGRIAANEIREPGTSTRTSAAAPQPMGSSAMAASHSGEVLISLQDVSVYIDGTPVLHDLNWEFLSGQHWAVAGHNGAGKSTLFRLLRGELSPALGGVIERFGCRKREPVWEIGKRIALLSPLLQARFAEQLPVEDAVASGFFHRLGAPEPLTAEQQKRVEEVMALCRLETLRGRTFGRLSYGQTRRVLLARALVYHPRILLLDEALDGLDAAAREEFSTLLDQLAGTGTSLAVVSHHEEDWPSLVTHVMRLEAGRIMEAGPVT
jgi:molybdate transport system ATP-binding protein